MTTITINSSDLTSFILDQMRSGNVVPGTEIRSNDDGTVTIEAPTK